MFFITVCVQNRASKPLLPPAIASGVVDSVEYLHDSGKWYARLFLVMPDHVHALLAFPSGTSLTSRVATWKSYTAKKYSITWQARYFDHRLRSDESVDEKAHYIRMNPVRAGLVPRFEDWPYVFDAFAARRGRLALPS